MATVAARATREFDLIVYGANGFTGALAVDYLARTYPHLSIAIAGRDAAKIRARADATRDARGVTFPTVRARRTIASRLAASRATTVGNVTSRASTRTCRSPSRDATRRKYARARTRRGMRAG